MTTPGPEEFLIFSLSQTLNNPKYINVKDDILRKAAKTQGVKWENVADLISAWIAQADKAVKAAAAASAAAAAVAAASAVDTDRRDGPISRTRNYVSVRHDDDDEYIPYPWEPERLRRDGLRGGAKRKRPSRKLRPSRKAQKKNRGFRRTRKSQKSQKSQSR